MKTSFSEATQNNTSTDFAVKFFQLQPDETAIVRILVDSEEDLAAYGFHEITDPEGKIKRISCLRESVRDDASKCPLCALSATQPNAAPFDQLIYIHMLQYYPDGRIEAKTWGRKPPKGTSGKSIIEKIQKALSIYGPLSNYVSAINRTGSGRDTNYDITFNLPEATYPAASFPLDKNLFENYTEDGTLIKNWTADEMNTYLATGTMPQNNSNANTPAPAPFNVATAAPAYDAVPEFPAASIAPQMSSPAPAPFAQLAAQPAFVQPAPMQSAMDTPPFSTTPVTPATVGQPVMDRPVRRYN